MTKEEIEKVEDLLDDGLDTLLSKKQFAKNQRMVIKEIAEVNGLDKSSVKKVMMYHHYKGKNWENGNPLVLDKGIKEKDKISPIFIKLLELYETLSSIGDLDFLKPYTDALEKCGLTINYNPCELSLKEDKDVIIEKIETASNYQTNIDTLSEELKEEKASESEEIGFSPKSEYTKVLSIYDKIKSGDASKVEDKVSTTITDTMLKQNAYTILTQMIDESKEED